MREKHSLYELVDATKYFVKNKKSIDKYIERLDREEPLDPGIKEAVRILMYGGVQTFESCEGGKGHLFTNPTIRFEGGKEEGFRAYAIAQYNGLRPSRIQRCWEVSDGELEGPIWQMELIPEYDTKPLMRDPETILVTD